MTLSRRVQRKREKSIKTRKLLLQPVVASGLVALTALAVAIAVAVTMKESDKGLMAILIVIAVVSAGYCVFVLTQKDRRSVDASSSK